MVGAFEQAWIFLKQWEGLPTDWGNPQYPQDEASPWESVDWEEPPEARPPAPHPDQQPYKTPPFDPYHPYWKKAIEESAVQTPLPPPPYWGKRAGPAGANA